MLTTELEFYRGDPDRWPARESDFGYGWTNTAWSGGGWPRWRVSWAERTGELFAVALAGDVDRPLEVLCRGLGPDLLRTVMHGWAEGAWRDVAWVRARLGRYAPSLVLTSAPVT